MNPKVTVLELSKILKADRSTILRNIDKLKKLGRIERAGSDKSGHWHLPKKDDLNDD